MTDAELQAWWPALGLVVTELRRTEYPATDSLVDAVRTGTCSSEILGGVGVLLYLHHAHRPQLGDPTAAAWGAVMADVYRAFPDLRLRHWFLRLVGR